MIVPSLESELYCLFEAEIAEMWYAEKNYCHLLDRMAAAACCQSLVLAFEEHRRQTEVQVRRLTRVCSAPEQGLRSRRCPVFDGAALAVDQLAHELEESCALDAALIAAAQRLEHFEIASYGTLVEWAKQLELPRAVELLEESLDEEKRADALLSEIARDFANHRGHRRRHRPDPVGRYDRLRPYCSV